MKTFLGKTVAETLGLPVKAGEFGVEVEVEGNSALPIDISQRWVTTVDGSLRGEAREYVFSAPLNYEETVREVKVLYNKLEGKVNDSMRAGAHVHVNCLTLTIREMFTFMAAYYCLEDLLTEDLGEERQGNLFCLRLSDADYANGAINQCLADRSLTARNGLFNNANLRYAALNLVSVTKFGSLEFRAMKTPQTVEPLLEWIDLLKVLKHNSTTLFKDPAELLTSMSANGGAATVEVLLGRHAAKQLAKPNFEKSLYDGIRAIQHWVFLNSWEK